MPAIEDIKRIAEVEFSDIVKTISQIDILSREVARRLSHGIL